MLVVLLGSGGRHGRESDARRESKAERDWAEVGQALSEGRGERCQAARAERVEVEPRSTREEFRAFPQLQMENQIKAHASL